MTDADADADAVAPARTAAVAPGSSPWKGWAAISAVSLGIFCLITSELLPVGLLTPVGDSLGVSDGTAGLMVTVPGLIAGFCAPLVTVGAGRLDRRLVLCVLIALMAVANLAAALAPGFAVVLAARLLVGVSVGGFWAIAGGLAVRLVPERHVGRATAVVFGGVPTASVLGVPAGTLLGELGGWRTAFAAVAALGLVTLIALLLLLPALPADRGIRFGELPALLRDNRAVRAGVAADRARRAPAGAGGGAARAVRTGTPGAQPRRRSRALARAVHAAPRLTAPLRTGVGVGLRPARVRPPASPRARPRPRRAPPRRARRPPGSRPPGAGRCARGTADPRCGPSRSGSTGRGFTYVVVNGVYDGRTRRGVAQLQSDRGISGDPQGVYGPATRAAFG
ncbi:hypothetical protein GCM10020254_72550 [Streptomyces goshikiensis]